MTKLPATTQLQILKGDPDDDELAALVVALDVVRARNAELADAKTVAAAGAAEIAAAAGTAEPSRWQTVLAPRPWRRPTTWAVRSRTRGRK